MKKKVDCSVDKILNGMQKRIDGLRKMIIEREKVASVATIDLKPTNGKS